MPATVRAATLADAEAVARVHVSSWRVAYRGLVPDAYLAGLRWQDRYDRWVRALAGTPHPRESTLVAAIDDGPVVGFVSFGPARDEDAPTGCAEVYALYVLPAMWGCGIGTAVLAGALETAATVPPGPLVWVLAANAAARRFYQRTGFVADGATRLTRVGGVELDTVRYCRQAPGPVTGAAGP